MTPMEIVLLIAVVVLAGWVAVLTGRQARMQRRFKTLLDVDSNLNLEDLLVDHLEQVTRTTGRVEELNALARQLQVGARSSLQHMGVLRFNPFSDSGGDQSFAVALVDGRGGGVVLSGLHGRDGTRTYAKPLVKWESTYTLTEEEKRAIALAYQQKTG